MTPPRPMKIVPACGECNSALSYRPPWSIVARRRFMHHWIARRYARILTTPPWPPEELGTLGPLLQSDIRARLAKKARTLERLNWSAANANVFFILDSSTSAGARPSAG
jgi:hypothetical protein